MIVVAGGTGRLGSALVSRLAGSGRPVRVFSRGLTGAAPDGTESVVGDIRSEPDVQRAVAGAHVVVSAVQGFAGPGRVSPRTVDHEGNRRLARAAARVGADVVLVSLTHAAPDSPLEMAREKYAAEEAVRSAGTDWTIVRCSAFAELWVDLLERTAGRAHRPLVFGRGDRPIRWVSVDDVAAAVAEAVGDPSRRGRTLEVMGPEALTLHELAEKVMAHHRWSGAPRHVPPTVLRTGSVTVGALVPAVRRQMRAALAMDRLPPEAPPAGAASRRSVDDVLADRARRPATPA